MASLQLQDFSSLTWVLGTMAVVSLCTLLLAFYRFRAQRLDHIYSPFSFVPFLGHFWHARKEIEERPLEMSLEVTEKVGHKSWYLSGPALCVVFCTTEEEVQHILKNNFDNYVKGETFRYLLGDLLGNGIFASDGNIWRTQRKTASHMFNMKTLKNHMSVVFVDHAQKLVSKLHQAQSNPTQPVDLQQLFYSFTLDSICEIGFGTKLNSLEIEDVPFARAFDLTQHLCERRLSNPMFPIQRFFNIGNEGKIAQNMVILNDFAYQMIRERRESQDFHDRGDLLSRFLCMRDEDGSPFSDEYLRDVVINFMIAGRDTTAVASTWIFYELGKHPEWEQKVYEEVMQVVGERDPTYEDASELPIVQAVIWECLRLHPPVPRDTKTALKDDYLPNGVFIPAGTTVAYSPYIAGRSKMLWGEDACVFDPQRFIGQPEPSAFQMPIFNAGPRTCLGKHVAFLEMKLLLCVLVKHFRFELVPGQEEHYLPSLTLPMKGGLQVFPRSRQQSSNRPL